MFVKEENKENISKEKKIWDWIFPKKGVFKEENRIGYFFKLKLKGDL